MLCMKDIISDAKTKFEDTKDIVLERSLDFKMSLSRKGSGEKPIKSFQFHNTCSTPILKIALIMLGVMMAMAMMCAMMKRAKN